MKRLLFLLLFAATAGATFAQTSGRASAEPRAREDLWQRLTPEQRDQLWRSLVPEQKAEIWHGLAPHEQQAMRERLAPGELEGLGPTRMHRREPRIDRGEAPHRMMTMTPEERRQMREQIREANRLRRERAQAEREQEPSRK